MSAFVGMKTFPTPLHLVVFQYLLNSAGWLCSISSTYNRKWREMSIVMGVAYFSAIKYLSQCSSR